MQRLRDLLETHPNIEDDLITHPFPASVMHREADIVLREFEIGHERLIRRKIARLGVSFYASRDYAERRLLPEHREDWKVHKVIAFADQASNAELGRWSDKVAHHSTVPLRCASQSENSAAARSSVGICALTCFVGNPYGDPIRVAPRRLLGVSNVWLLVRPDFAKLPATRAVVDFVAAASARTDKVVLPGRVFG